MFRDCDKWSGYFDTACSPLNPNNRGYTFYVYGNLPIFIVRYVAEFNVQLAPIVDNLAVIVGRASDLGSTFTSVAAELRDATGYDGVFLVGRQLSAVSNILTILILYFIASRLYGRKVGLLAATFTTLGVMLIQQSHFFTVDTVANLFIFLSLLFAAEITRRGPPASMPQYGAPTPAPIEEEEARIRRCMPKIPGAAALKYCGRG